VFVNSVSDLFHEDVPDVFLDEVFAVMALADRHTFQILTKRAVRWLSCEPLLEPVDLLSARYRLGAGRCSAFFWGRGVDWVVVGGESGKGARPFDLAWARDLVAQCANADVACFVKQLGANPIDPWADTGALINDREPVRPTFRDSHGGDMAEWPEDLRVREFPRVAERVPA
jgi:protein gp37